MDRGRAGLFVYELLAVGRGASLPYKSHSIVPINISGSRAGMENRVSIYLCSSKCRTENSNLAPRVTARYICL